MKQDEYGRLIFSEREVCNHLYSHPDMDFSSVCIHDPKQHNHAIETNYSKLSKLQMLPNLDTSPEEWHHQNQQKLLMPAEYYKLDIAKYILDLCENEVELQRCGAELLEYADRGLIDFLKYLKYLVDTMRANNVIWGVGRGSSVSSFVLYKLGVHRINSIQYDLDYKEFFH